MFCMFFPRMCCVQLVQSMLTKLLSSVVYSIYYIIIYVIDSPCKFSIHTGYVGFLTLGGQILSLKCRCSYGKRSITPGKIW